MNIRRRSDLGLAPRTLDAYSRGLAEYLMLCAAASTDPLTAGRDHITRYVRELTQRLPWRASADTAPSSAAGPRLVNATVQQRLTAVRFGRNGAFRRFAHRLGHRPDLGLRIQPVALLGNHCSFDHVRYDHG
jgi:hypothetical protein